MKILTHQTELSSLIFVTGVATLLYPLMDTAGGVSNSEDYFQSKSHGGPANALVITPENGDVRLGYGGNVPTGSLGMLLKAGIIYSIPNTDLPNLRLISASGVAISCSIELAVTRSNEDLEGVGGGGATTPLGEGYVSGLPKYEEVANETAQGDGSSSFIVNIDDNSRMDFQINVTNNPSSASVIFTVDADIVLGSYVPVTLSFYDIDELDSLVLGDTFEALLIDNGDYTKAARSMRFNVNISGASNDVDYIIEAKKTTL